jgi:hypothetical protein
LIISINELESCLGKRSRCENRVSQDYSHCDDLAGLESISPAQEFYERYSDSVQFALPTQYSTHDDSSTTGASIDSSYTTQSSVIAASAKNTTVGVSTQSTAPRLLSSSIAQKPSFLGKDAWGWFVNGGDDDTFS